MISISVMASEERSHLFPYLKEKLGDVPFAIDAPRGDRKNVGVWENCKRAWKLYNPKATHHLVVQDDAIICDNLRGRIEHLLEKAGGDYAYQLFFGRELASTPQEKTFAQVNGYIIKNLMESGVAIMLPTNRIYNIMNMAELNNTNIDDSNIGYALQMLGMKTIYPVPCFVDHRSMVDTPTLVGPGESERTSLYFIDK